MSEANHPTPETSPCDDGTLCDNHSWVEEYYGTKCTKCNTFYPHGCAPWDEDVWEDADEDFDPYEAAGESRFGLPGGGGL